MNCVRKDTLRISIFCKTASNAATVKFKVFADEFKIDKYFRFEGQSNPSDQAILYAISSDKHQLKGVLVNAYGIYSEPVTDEMLQKLDIRK